MSKFRIKNLQFTFVSTDTINLRPETFREQLKERSN